MRFSTLRIWKFFRLERANSIIKKLFAPPSQPYAPQPKGVGKGSVPSRVGKGSERGRFRKGVGKGSVPSMSTFCLPSSARSVHRQIRLRRIGFHYESLRDYGRGGFHRRQPQPERFIPSNLAGKMCEHQFPRTLSFDAGQMFVALVEFRAGTAGHPAVILPGLLRVVIKLPGHLAANFPQPFQPVVMFRFHDLSPKVQAVSPTRAFPAPK